MDEDVEAARRRGLPAVQLSPLALADNALQPELAAMGGKFDAAVFYASSASSSSGSSGSWSASGSGSWGDEAAEADAAQAQQQQAAAGGLAASWWQPESLGELRRVLKPGGRLCVQAPVSDEAAARAALLAAGFTLRDWERTLDGCARLVAAAP